LYALAGTVRSEK